ncbi:ATP synthase epsilon chain [Vulgatibacter incomptus]|uniref:ATP synthase epsilon chain n=1 Tax=Vulgatibacter incomptus TaxID=1391653 RepID=A0A0K1PIC9_9BACT|nr:F0F1 ATP synthase subunit epsilon [Vulgatibacter incomptus]AKU92869.1 ATP synthase epsilon chain [Vulgatibacter incomptus]
MDSVKAPGADGSFGVLPGHTPFLTVMQPGELSYTVGNKEEHYFVGGGFVEVAEGKVIVLAESAEPVSEIDVDRAKAALAQAQERLKALRQEEEAAAIERARVKRAAARITVAGRR